MHKKSSYGCLVIYTVYCYKIYAYVDAGMAKRRYWSKHTKYESVVPMTSINPEAALKNKTHVLSLLYTRLRQILQHNCMHHEHIELNNSNTLTLKWYFSKELEMFRNHYIIIYIQDLSCIPLWNYCTVSHCGLVMVSPIYPCIKIEQQH